MKQLTLGSLFDGIGGFCYAAGIPSGIDTGCTIKPLWAAEVEPNCIDITRYRFKDVMHVGSVIRHSLRSIWRDRMTYRNKEGYADPTAGAAIHEAEPKVKKREYNPEVTNLVSVLKQMIDIAGYEMVGRIVLRDKDTGKEYR